MKPIWNYDTNWMSTIGSETKTNVTEATSEVKMASVLKLRHARAAVQQKRAQFVKAKRVEDLPDLLTVKEAADKLKLRPSTIYAWIYSGFIVPIRLGVNKRRIRISVSCLQELMLNGAQTAS